MFVAKTKRGRWKLLISSYRGLGAVGNLNGYRTEKEARKFAKQHGFKVEKLRHVI